jgi:hypothetical protein
MSSKDENNQSKEKIDTLITSIDQSMAKSKKEKRQCIFMSYTAVFAGILSMCMLLYFYREENNSMTMFLPIILIFECIYYLLAIRLVDMHNNISNCYLKQKDKLFSMQYNMNQEDEIKIIVNEWVKELSGSINAAYLSCHSNIARLILFCDSGASAIQKRVDELKAKIEKEKGEVDFNILVVMDNSKQNLDILEGVTLGSLKFENGAWNRLL